MTTYDFSLRFRFPQKSFIAEDAEFISITLPIDGRQVVLQSRPANQLISTKLLDAISCDFPSIEAALSYGRMTKNTIAICCALLHMGVEIGKHEETLDISDVQTNPDGFIH
jgi:hypothetical protein